MNYYDENSKAFIERTLKVDMTAFYDKFLPLLPSDGTILDVGSGPGRDSKEFLTRGYKPTLLEPSKELAQFAREYTELEVIEEDLLSFKTEKKFNGIWACASLLHLKSEELPLAFQHLYNLLEDEGVLYASFKQGNFEGERDGRWFTDMNENMLRSILSETSFEIIELWESQEMRKGFSLSWLNLILKK